MGVRYTQYCFLAQMACSVYHEYCDVLQLQWVTMSYSSVPRCWWLVPLVTVEVIQHQPGLLGLLPQPNHKLQIAIISRLKVIQLESTLPLIFFACFVFTNHQQQTVLFIYSQVLMLCLNISSLYHPAPSQNICLICLLNDTFQQYMLDMVFCFICPPVITL